MSLPGKDEKGVNGLVVEALTAGTAEVGPPVPHCPPPPLMRMLPDSLAQG